jgi:serine/threonine protein kinase
VTRYELLERIGVGGMAEIFRGKAVAAGGFEKPVAIKRILPHLSQDKRFVELLIQEAKMLSLLKHRNIVQIFDVGLGDDGQYFLVMEYVDGKDLGAVQRAFEARRRRIEFDLALHIGAEICEALEHAHSARADGKPMLLVHRDVSPSNVLLSRAGEIKLTDFGIAKRAEQEATSHGAVRGKFAYISPEQARNERVSPVSDVFSVGILLWELIVNRRLFSGLGDLEALRAVREGQVPRALEADPRLSPEIDQLLMAALDRDPKRRPTAGELGAKLRSMRYSLDVTVGDPATELARIIETADEVARESRPMAAMEVPPRTLGGMSPPPRHAGGFDSDHNEATVIRIRTADAFQMRDQDGMARAREVIDRFEEEETRQSQLSGDQLRILRAGRDSSADAPLAPAPLPGVAPTRNRRPTDEPTTARPPLDLPSLAGLPTGPGPSDSFDADESTKLVERPERSLDRRTPQPLPQRRPATASPPTAGPGSGVLQLHHEPVPGTVHDRNPLRGHGLPPGAPPHTPPPMMAPPGLPPGPPPGPMMPPPQGHPGPMMPGGPGWGGPPPGGPPVYPQRGAMPGMGFPPRSKQALRPWVLVVGALVMAVLAFMVTRAFLS